MTRPGAGAVVHQLLDPGFLSEQLANLQAQHRNILSPQDYQDMEADLRQRRARAVSGASPAQAIRRSCRTRSS